MIHTIDQGQIESPCGLYRYLWWHEMAPAMFEEDGDVRTALWVVHNPSKADGKVLDPSVKKMIQFGRRWGCRRTLVVNRHAFRATDPKDLRRAFIEGIDIDGPENHSHVEAALKDAHNVTVFAWGKGISLGQSRKADGSFGEHRGYTAPPPPFEPPYEDMLAWEWEHGTVSALALNADGSPKHPLYVAYDAVPHGHPYSLKDLRKRQRAA